MADEQVDDAVAYISGDNPTAALQWLERLLDRAKSLATFPDSDRVVPELGRQDIREIIVRPYRVMYRRTDDRVEIAAVRHEAREFDEKEIAPQGGALVFRHLGFAVAIELLGRKGPDLEISRGGLSAIVEVARFRPVYSGPPEQDGDLPAEQGNPERDVTKSLEKLVGKFRQLDGELSVIAIWNDDDALEELEMSEAVRVATGLDDLPSSLQFVLYGSGWHRPWRELRAAENGGAV